MNDPSESSLEGSQVPRKLTDDEVLEIRARVASGESIASEARRLARSETSVRRALRGTRSYKGLAFADGSTGEREPLPPGRPARVSEDVIRAILAARGERRDDVARRHGVSSRYVAMLWSGKARKAIARVVVSR